MSHPENTLKEIIKALKDNDTDAQNLIVHTIRNQINLIAALDEQKVLPHDVSVKLLTDIQHALEENAR